MKHLKKIEVYFPYFAILFFFFTKKLQISPLYYLVSAILIGIYLFPLRLLMNVNKREVSHVFSSFLFSGILVLSSVFLFNSESTSIKTLLGISGIISFVLLIYLIIVNELNVKQFVLLLGFNVLAGLYLTL